MSHVVRMSLHLPHHNPNPVPSGSKGEEKTEALEAIAQNEKAVQAMAPEKKQARMKKQAEENAAAITKMTPTRKMQALRAMPKAEKGATLAALPPEQPSAHALPRVSGELLEPRLRAHVWAEQGEGRQDRDGSLAPAVLVLEVSSLAWLE